MPDYANGLVKVVAIFGVINRVSATTPAHTQPVAVIKGDWVGHGPQIFGWPPACPPDFA